MLQNPQNEVENDPELPLIAASPHMGQGEELVSETAEISEEEIITDIERSSYILGNISSRLAEKRLLVRDRRRLAIARSFLRVALNELEFGTKPTAPSENTVFWEQPLPLSSRLAE